MMDVLCDDDQFFCCCSSSSLSMSNSESCLSSTSSNDDDDDRPCTIGRLNRRRRLMSDGNRHLWLTTMMEQGIRVNTAAAAADGNRLMMKTCTSSSCTSGCCCKTVSAAADETPFHCYVRRRLHRQQQQGQVTAPHSMTNNPSIRTTPIHHHRNQHKSNSSSSWNHVLSTCTSLLALLMLATTTIAVPPPPLSSSPSPGLIAEVVGRDMANSPSAMMMSIGGGGGGGNLVLVQRTDPAAAAAHGRQPSLGLLYANADFARIASAAGSSPINSSNNTIRWGSQLLVPAVRNGNEVDDEGDDADGRSRAARRMSSMGVNKARLILDDETINSNSNNSSHIAGRAVDTIGTTYSSITHSHARASPDTAAVGNSVHLLLSAGELDADEIGSVLRWKNPDIPKSLHKKYRLLRKTCASEVLRELDSEDWKLFKRRTTTGDTVQVLNDGLSGTVYLLTGIVDLDPDSLFHAIVDDPYAITEWNPAIKKINVLQHINNRTLIFHQALNQKSAGLFRERDFVNMNFWKKQRDTYYQFYESVEFPGCPESAEYVRGENGPSGFVFAPYHADDSDDDTSTSTNSNSSSHPAARPIRSNRTRYQWLMDVDFKFQWMFQRLLKNVIPGVMFEYMDSVRRRAHQQQVANNEDEDIFMVANNRQRLTDDASVNNPPMTNVADDVIRTRALGWSNMNKLGGPSAALE